MKGSIANIFMQQLVKHKPKNFLEIGVFCGVTARNVCDLLHKLHGSEFKYTGVDLFGDIPSTKGEVVPKYLKNQYFNNPLKRIYYNYIIRENLNSIESVTKFLEKYKGNVTLIKGDTNKVLKDHDFKEIDYVFLDGGHSYETVINDLRNLYNNLKDKRRIILCDDYNHPECPGLKKAIDEFAKTYHLKLEIIHGRFAELTT